MHCCPLTRIVQCLVAVYWHLVGLIGLNRLMCYHSPIMDLLQQVNEAFKTCNSLLALSRSPLAASALVTPALVLDNVTPTPDERGRALRIVLQWGIEQLAPAPAQFPFDVFRPWDDPTWREPRWWRYNILRHRYLEPLHPDDFVAGGRFTDTLLNLTGISTADALFDERNRRCGM